MYKMSSLREVYKPVSWAETTNIASNPLPFSTVCTPPRNYLQPLACPPHCGCPSEYTTDMAPFTQEYTNPTPPVCEPEQPSTVDRLASSIACSDRDTCNVGYQQQEIKRTVTEAVQSSMSDLLEQLQNMVRSVPLPTDGGVYEQYGISRGWSTPQQILAVLLIIVIVLLIAVLCRKT